jgi:hypothetical protein
MCKDGSIEYMPTIQELESIQTAFGKPDLGNMNTVTAK